MVLNNTVMEKGQSSDGYFSELGIAPKLLDILGRNKFVTPTPIQKQAIPPALEGKDIIGIAQTGTGKTLAFGIPMIQRIAQNEGKSMGLVVLPTRELALQVSETLKKIGSPLGLRAVLLIGGADIRKQQRALLTKPHIIIATPGRLIDHLDSRRISLEKVATLVLDEADRMLDMGFAPQINAILKSVPKGRQTMLFSATMPDDIIRIAKATMVLPLRIEVAPSGTAIDLVSQELFFVHRDDKLALVKTILTRYQGSVLVFCRTKHGAKRLTKALHSMNYSATEIHSNRTLNQRLAALDGFKIGKYRVLVATDIAARGIDVKGIQLVLNYDLPDSPEDYVHRIGRTGRAGMPGHAISLATPDQKRDVYNIERLIRRVVPLSKTPIFSKEDRQPLDTQTARDPHERRSYDRKKTQPFNFRKRPQQGPRRRRR